MSHRIVALAATVALAAGLIACSSSSGSFTTADAWARPGTAGAETAAYLTVTNTGQRRGHARLGVEPGRRVRRAPRDLDRRLGDDRDAPGRRDRDPRRRSVTLAPGGMHLMVMGLTNDLVVGDTLEVRPRLRIGRERDDPGRRQAALTCPAIRSSGPRRRCRPRPRRRLLARPRAGRRLRRCSSSSRSSAVRDEFARCRGSTSPSPSPRGIGGRRRRSWAARSVAAPPIELTDQDGRPFSLASLRGSPIFVFFGYTHCPDVCPATIGTIGEAMAATGLGATGRVRDASTRRATPPPGCRIRRSTCRPGSSRLTGTRRRDRRRRDGLGRAVREGRRPAIPTAYAMSHTADVFLRRCGGRPAGDVPVRDDPRSDGRRPSRRSRRVPHRRRVGRRAEPADRHRPSAPGRPVGRSERAGRPRSTLESSSSDLGLVRPAEPVILALSARRRRSARSTPRPTGVQLTSLAAATRSARRSWPSRSSRPAWPTCLVRRVGRRSRTRVCGTSRSTADARLARRRPGVRRHRARPRDDGRRSGRRHRPPTRPTLDDVGGVAKAVTTDPAPDLRLSRRSTTDALADHQPFVLVVDSTKFRVSPACGRAIVMARYLRRPVARRRVHPPRAVSLLGRDRHPRPRRLARSTPTLTEPGRRLGDRRRRRGARGRCRGSSSSTGTGSSGPRTRGSSGSDDVDVIVSLIEQGGYDPPAGTFGTAPERAECHLTTRRAPAVDHRHHGYRDAAATRRARSRTRRPIPVTPPGSCAAPRSPVAVSWRPASRHVLPVTNRRLDVRSVRRPERRRRRRRPRRVARRRLPARERRALDGAQRRSLGRRASAAPTGDIPDGLDRARRRRAQQGPPLSRQPASRRSRPSTAPVFAKLADILGVEDGYPELDMKPAFVQVPQLVLTDALDAAQADAGRRRQGLQPDDRRRSSRRSTSCMPPVAALGYNGQWPGPTIRVNQGDKVRGDLHEQPQGDDRRPLPRRGVRRLLPGRRPVRDPEADRPGRDLHLRLRGRERRLAHVPLASQRHRPGRSWAARGVHRRAEARTREVRPRVHLDLERRARRLHDQRPRLPGDRPGARRAGRDRPRPVHERGDHDAPVAPPRDADARWSPGTAGRSATRSSRATPSASTPVSATTSSSRRRRSASGPSTATSCRTPRARTGCSAWSTRSSSCRRRRTSTRS